MKNILVFEDSSKAKFGGGQRVTLDVMGVLSERYNLVLFDCEKDSIFKDKAEAYVKTIFKLKCNGKVVGGEKSSFGVGYIEVFLFPFLFFKNIISISKFLKSNNYDKNNSLMYAATKKNLLLVYILKKMFGIKFVYHAHSFDNKKSIFYKIIETPLREADRILSVSNLINNNINLKNSQTVYNAIDILSQKEKDLKSKEKVIVASFSTLIKLKGIEYFMQSYQFLEHKDKVEFWIFGDGVEKEYLKQFENSNVKLKGFADNSEKIMEDEVDIVVVSSITEEACPMVPLEAFKCGIPVISTNIGGQAEIVKDAEVGFYVPIKDPEAIAKKIDYLIDNDDVYKKFSKQSIQYSKNFSKEEYKKTINKIFKDMM